MPNGENMLGGLNALRQKITDANADRQKLFEDALKRLRDERVGPTTAEKLFAISSALSRPTRTGKFIEELGNVGGVLGAQEAEKRKAQMDRAAMLEKYGFGQSDATIAGLESQLDMGLKMQAAAAAARKAEAEANKPDYRVIPAGGSLMDVKGYANLPVLTPEQAVAAKAAAGGGPLRFRTVDGRALEI